MVARTSSHHRSHHTGNGGLNLVLEQQPIFTQDESMKLGGRYLLAPFNMSKEEGRSSLTRFPKNILYTPLDNTLLYSTLSA